MLHRGRPVPTDHRGGASERERKEQRNHRVGAGCAEAPASGARFRAARRSRFTAARHSVPAQDGGGAAAARSAGVIEAAAAGGSRAAPAGRRGERSGTVLAWEEGEEGGEGEGEEGGFALPPSLPPSGEEGRLSCASWEAFCLVPQRPKYREFNGWVFSSFGC